MADNHLHESPCEHLKHASIVQDQMFAMLEDIQRENAKQSKQLAEQKEILIVWKNAKGFVATVIVIGNVLKWLVGIGGAIAAIWYFLSRGIK